MFAEMRKKEKLIYWNREIEELLSAGEVSIYGAGAMGKAVKKCLENAPYHMKIKRFIVASMQNNPDYIEEIPVIDMAHGMSYRDELVVVALHEKYADKALKDLKSTGFRRVLPLTFDSDAWSEIRGNWFWYQQNKNSEMYLNRVLMERLHIYVAHHIADRRIKKINPENSFEIPIQVGAALTNKRIAAITDNEGDNISNKNKKYCELTALYWIWKHDRAEYAGLSHYRRKFAISDQMAVRLLESDVDVVLTVPVLNVDGVRRQYCRDHVEADWDIMMEGIAKLYPKYVNTAEQVQTGNYYYAYNMFIARRDILDRYCRWLFPLLFYCEQRIGERNDDYQGRYIGFLAERLMTIFFVHHEKQYKLSIVKKHFVPAEI